MTTAKFLAWYMAVAQEVRQQLFRQLKKRAQKFSAIDLEMVQVLDDFSQGGKAIRSALTVLGYQCAGGSVNQEILAAATAVDFLHSALLIADDIMDQGRLRRGKLTVHQLYARQLASNYARADVGQFGTSMALNLSLMSAFFAQEIFADLKLASQRVRQAQSLMNRYLVLTTFGQAIDVARQGNLTTASREIMAIHYLKTAQYTIVGPLQVGAILGGARPNQLKAMQGYGKKVGIAFQLRDDELGLYGQEDKLGKSVLSDLREGKNTLLFVQAFRLANPEQKRVLQAAFGNARLSTMQFKLVQDLVKETGALAYSQKLSRQLVEAGKKYVPQITPKHEFQDTLYNLANFIITREK